MKHKVKLPRIFKIPYTHNRNMARKDSHWFSHDTNATNDPKIIALMCDWEDFSGYGRWWRLCEALRSEQDYKINIKTKFAIASIAALLKFDTEKAQRFINDCVEKYELLRTDGTFIWSESLVNRMSGWDNKKKAYSERGKKGAQAKWGKKEEEDGTSMAQASKTMAQASKNDGTSKEIDGYINYNKLKETITTTSYTEPPPKIEGYYSLETLKQKCLSDSEFLAQFYRIGLTPEFLPRWIDAYHRRLQFDNSTLKTEKDYRWHFGNWVVKFYKRMQPEDYSPLGEVKEDPKPTKMKTAKEIIEDRKRKEAQDV